MEGIQPMVEWQYQYAINSLTVSTMYHSHFKINKFNAINFKFTINSYYAILGHLVDVTWPKNFLPWYFPPGWFPPGQLPRGQFSPDNPTPDNSDLDNSMTITPHTPLPTIKFGTDLGENRPGEIVPMWVVRGNCPGGNCLLGVVREPYYCRNARYKHITNLLSFRAMSSFVAVLSFRGLYLLNGCTDVITQSLFPSLYIYLGGIWGAYGGHCAPLLQGTQCWKARDTCTIMYTQGTKFPMHILWCSTGQAL